MWVKFTTLNEISMKKHQKTSFAEIVQSASEKPDRQNRRRLPPGRHDKLLVTRDQRRWTLVAESIDPDVAPHLVAAGASLAHDPCGCGGTCGIELIDSKVTRQLPQVGSPEVSHDPRHPGLLSHWAAEDKPTDTLVLASGRVIWGNALS